MNESHDRMWRDGGAFVPGVGGRGGFTGAPASSPVVGFREGCGSDGPGGVEHGSSDPFGGIAMEVVPAVGYEGARQLIRFCLRLAKATRGCVAACDEFEPDVVLGMGGFTSAPAMFGARWFRKRGTATLIHESNAVPGKANRWAGRFADHVAVGLADCAGFLGTSP